MATERTENADADRFEKEIAGHLGRARALLALAHRQASKMPLEADDREKSGSALAEAIGLCVQATHIAKAQKLYRLADSGLNPSELRQSVERALKNPPRGNSGGHRASPTSALRGDSRAAPLLAQLDACRRMNLQGLRWLLQASDDRDDQWRGKQFLKIAEQLCVVTALESKLMGQYPLGDSQADPVAMRRAVAQWAVEATRRELADE